MINIKERWSKNKLEIISIIFYIVIVFGLTAFHEAWRDEAQAWLIARELSIPQLIGQMKYEGHFLLWYLILMPFAKLDFPYITENIISCIFSIATVIIFMKTAPFKKWKKVLIIFSFPMIYLFPVISRCYCLIPFAMVCISALYKDKFKRPILYSLLIVLLANTHVIMYSMVGYLILDFCIKAHNENINKKGLLKAFVILLVLLLISVLPLVGCLHSNHDLGNEHHLLYKICDMFVLEPILILQQLFAIFEQYSFAFIMIAAIYLLFYEAVYYTKDFLKIYLILLWQFFIYAFIFGNSNQRSATVLWIVLFFIWNRDRNKKEIPINRKKQYRFILVVLMVLNICFAGIYSILDIKYDFSTSKQVSKYINENLDNKIFLVGNQAEYCSAIIPYIRHAKFYHIQRKEYFSFATWDSINNMDLTENMFFEALERFKEEKNLYYIYTPYKSDFTYSDDTKVIKKLIEEGVLKEIFESGLTMYSQETYIIYEIQK